MIKRNKDINDYSQTCNRILEGTTIEGEIHSKGDFRVDGKLKGNVHISGKLVVGKKGVVDGEIKAGSATVSGLIKGTLQVTELLALQTTAKVHGDVSTGKLSVDPGAEFTGSCSMGAVVREIQKHDAEKKQSGKQEKEQPAETAQKANGSVL